MTFIIGFVLVLATGIMNRLRGGALNDYLSEKGKGRVSHTITRFLLVLLSTTSIYLGLKFGIGFDAFSSEKSIYFTIGTFLSLFIIGLLPGWGAYFDLGHTERGYVDHREVLWIDWVLYKIYGPIWWPTQLGEMSAFEKDEGLEIAFDAFDLDPSPTGRIRPFEWRAKRDFTGMCLRGLHFYIPTCLVIFAQLHVCADINFYQVLYIIPCGLLFGPIYKVSQHIKLGCFFEKLGMHGVAKHVHGYTHVGEILTGMILLSGIPYFTFIL
jgi:hypothetical protein